MPRLLYAPIALAVLLLSVESRAADLLVEAESFTSHGGWQLDTQFINAMGSPYLLAHGMGRPVEDATTTVRFSEPGRYHVFVRTLDWVERWNAPGDPGRFQVLVEGQPLDADFGTTGADWAWQPGGTVEIAGTEVELALHDLTGFDGRCDAIYFSRDAARPPNDAAVIPSWRRRLLGLDEAPTLKDSYDLVVIGGGYSGMGAAISAARMGCKVALIQNRPVLGGNGSSEVRVWAMGHIRRGKYPRIGEIVEEFADKATKSPGRYEEFGDAHKEQVVRSEPNIDLFLNHHAYKVDTQNKEISAVYAFDTRTSEHKKFVGHLYADCTGHGTIGYLAGADWEMEAKGRMGMSNMWRWAEGDEPVSFPETPWALDLTMADFPYPRDHHGQWFWESGFDEDPLAGAEAIRDWNLRAVYGAFNAMKNRDGADRHKTAYLTWIAYIGGPRESRRLMGDVILTQDDIVEKREFPDGCVPSTWSIDLHYPKQQYAKKFPENPFISIAEHDNRIDRSYGYPLPYRCFYSRNVGNLFMAGRCISVTHEALGTTRVMKTCGMMGEVVGKAAAVCLLRNCDPRGVYEDYWDEMDELLRLPGKAYRPTLHAEIVIPEDALPEASPWGPMEGLDPATLAGTVIDDRQATKTGSWTEGTGLKGFVGYAYSYASPGRDTKCQFTFEAAASGQFEIRLAYQPHENRGSHVPVVVKTPRDEERVRIDMRKPAPLEHGFVSLGKFRLRQDDTVSVILLTENAGGYVHADAIQVLPVEN